jgi:copper resistance protein D
MALVLTLVRWVHLSASILLAGIYLFETVTVEPVAGKRPADVENVLGVFRRLSWSTARWTLLVLLLSWFSWGWLVAANMSGDPLLECLLTGDWWSVLTSTQFGHLWFSRMGLALIFGMTLYLRWPRRSGKRNDFGNILAGLSTLLLVSLAWAGHAAADPSALGIVHLLGDAVHLLASGFWPAGLMPLAAFLFLFLRSSRIGAIDFAGTVVRRFSATSLAAVGVMACTGLLNSVFMAGNFGALLTSAYGRLLMLKIILFFAMIGFGGWNLLVLKPQLSIKPPTGGEAQQKKALHALVRNVLWEIGLAFLVILIVGLLGIASPPLR